MGVLEEGGFGASAKDGAGWGLGLAWVWAGGLVLVGAELMAAPCQELEGASEAPAEVASEGPHLRIWCHPGSSH